MWYISIRLASIDKLKTSLFGQMGVNMLLHKHSYKILTQVETKSEAEQLYSMGLKPNTHSSFTKKYMVVAECSVCGKLKKFIMKA